jgi:rhodanese-related sulfurtransferase
MTPVRSVGPEEAVELLRGGGLLVDIREAVERASGVIPGALHAPLSALGHWHLPAAAGCPVIFHCRSGGRTAKNADVLMSQVSGGEVYTLGGGIDRWRSSGHP